MLHSDEKEEMLQVLVGRRIIIFKETLYYILTWKVILEIWFICI